MTPTSIIDTLLTIFKGSTLALIGLPSLFCPRDLSLDVIEGFEILRYDGERLIAWLQLAETSLRWVVFR